MLNPITSSRPYISRWEQHLWVTRTTRAHVYTVDIWWYYTRFSLDHSYPANPDIKPWCCFSLFFLLILEGYNVKVDQHVLFPVGLGIYIYIVPSGIRLPHFDFESYENRWNQFMCIWIHDDSWARIYRSLYNYTYIYIIFPAINLHLVRGFPSHLWWPVSL